MSEDKRPISETYHHLGNGGLTVKVVDGGFGPELVVQTRHLGNLAQKLEAKVSKRSLEVIGHQLISAAKDEDGFSEGYIHQVDWRSPRHNEGLGVDLRRRLEDAELIESELEQAADFVASNQPVASDSSEGSPNPRELAEEAKELLGEEGLRELVDELDSRLYGDDE